MSANALFATIEKARRFFGNGQTANCAGSSLSVLSRETVLGVGISTCILVPELSDSILIVPDNWRVRSRMPRIPTPEPRD